jgi:hypothetical protein
MEQEIATTPTTEKLGRLGTITKWVFLSLIIATCLMALYRKFGG